MNVFSTFSEYREINQNKFYFHIMEIYINKSISSTIVSKHVILGVTLTIHEQDLYLKNL